MADIKKKTDGPATDEAVGFDYTKLPDYDNDFVDEEGITAFKSALDAPEPSPSQDDLTQPPAYAQSLFITALNDWRPIRQRVRKRKKKAPRRGVDETREGFVYGLLKWPLLFGIFGWIVFLGVSYLFTRLYIYIYEHFITWRGNRQRLRRQMNSQTTYQGWVKSAKQLDTYLGNDEWKKNDEYAYYDSKTISRVVKHMSKLRKQAEAEERNASPDTLIAEELRGLVEASVKNNFVGFENPRLYSETYYGTKEVVQEFTDEVEASLAFLKKTTQLDKGAKKSLYKHLHTNFGRTALCLSGGATFAYYHFGVAKALLDANLLPQVITGTSGGALVAALLATRTDEELKALLVPALANRITACEEGVFTWFARWWRTGARFDSVEWAKKCSWFSRGSMTFKEAYERTGRILNVTCVPSDPHSPSILANYLTAPDCVIWSAVMASAAVPGILNPVVLMKKNKEGKLEPYSFGHKWKDGSLRTDIPLKALNLHFNVNFSIVSQVNPHINLFFFSSRGSVGRPVTHRRGRGWRGGFLGSATEQYLKLDLTKWLKVLRHLELLPRPLGQDWSEIWLQRFSGTITLWPKSIPSDFVRILSDPTPKRLARMLHVGQLSAWPKLKFIGNRMKIERLIDQGRRATRPLIAEGGIANILSEDDLQAILKSAKLKDNVAPRPTLHSPGSSSEYVPSIIHRKDKSNPRTPQGESEPTSTPESPSLSQRLGSWWGRSQVAIPQRPQSMHEMRPYRYKTRYTPLDSPRSGYNWDNHGTGLARRGSLVDELSRQSQVFFDDDDFDREEEGTSATSGTEEDGHEEALFEEQYEEGYGSGVETGKESEAHEEMMDDDVEEGPLRRAEGPTFVGSPSSSTSSRPPNERKNSSFRDLMGKLRATTKISDYRKS